MGEIKQKSINSRPNAS